MAIPPDKHARKFYRCAFQRFDDAQVLQETAQAARAGGAVYLAGYAVECILKALILMQTVPGEREKLIQEKFKGQAAHNFDWLRSLYRQSGGAAMPRDVHRQFLLVSDWSTDLRYEPAKVDLAECIAFLKASLAILTWADGRL